MTRYVSAEKRAEDDFGAPFTFEPGEVVYDAATMNGAWATMTQQSHDLYARPGGLGVGRGQKYERRDNGELWLIEGGYEQEYDAYHCRAPNQHG